MEFGIYKEAQAIVTFGQHIEDNVRRHHDFLRKPELVGVLFEDLKGHERAMVRMLGYSVVERMGILETYEASDYAHSLIRSAVRDTRVRSQYEQTIE